MTDSLKFNSQNLGIDSTRSAANSLSLGLKKYKNGSQENGFAGYIEAVSRRCFEKKMCLRNFAKIHRKTPLAEYFFNKVAGFSQQLY